MPFSGFLGKIPVFLAPGIAPSALVGQFCVAPQAVACDRRVRRRFTGGPDSQVSIHLFSVAGLVEYIAHLLPIRLTAADMAAVLSALPRLDPKK